VRHHFDVLQEMKTIFIPAIILSMVTTMFAGQEKEDLPAHAIPMVQNWLNQCSEAVDICVFREQWIAPTKERPKGMLLRFGTITFVHKGSVKVGERVMMAKLVEYQLDSITREARIHPDRVSLVDGELHVVIFDKKDTELENGYWNVGDTINTFTFDDYFHHAFQSIKKTDPELKGVPN
jgi:hypothetical protein